MKIGLVGCGALGSYYGAKLTAAGEEVHFLLRSDFEVVRQSGVRIQSVEGEFVARPHCSREPAEIGACDLVLIGLKTTANDQFGRLLPPLLGPATAVVTLQNGLGNEEALAGLFGAARVLGGLCFVCLNRVAPGLVQHSAHGEVILGEYDGTARARTEEYADLFRHAGVRCRVTENLAQARWEKLLWNVPFNGLGVAGAAGLEAVLSGEMPLDAPLGSCLTTDRLLEDPRWAALVRELMREVLAAAWALGFPIPEGAVDDRIERTRRMGAYKASTLVDYERGHALELEGLFLEPLRRARAARVSTPRLDALCRILCQLNPEKKVAVA
jgi:2-dehydropantoate 2-reductase